MMTGDQFIDAIRRGENVRDQIWDRNARISENIAHAVARNVHAAKGCRKAHCPHGNPETMRAHMGHAAVLRAERAAGV